MLILKELKIYEQKLDIWCETRWTSWLQGRAVVVRHNLPQQNEGWFDRRLASLVAQRLKHLAYNAGDLGSIPGLGRFPGGRHGNPFCGVHGVAVSQTQPSDWAQHSKLVTQSRPTLCNPWTDCTDQAPLSMEFSRKEHLSGLPFPPPEDLPDPGIEPRSPVLQADSLPSEPPGKPKFVQIKYKFQYNHITFKVCTN